MDYKNGKIYRVICSATGRQYIGSTCSTLVKRLYNHKRKYNECMTKDFIEPKIFLIEDFPCDRKEQLLSRERFHIESNDCVNKVIPTRTIKEYYEQNKKKIKEDHELWKKKNKLKIKEYHKQYRQDNKETISKKEKEKFNCECGGKYTHVHKSTHLKTEKHIKFSHTIQTSQPSDAYPQPSSLMP